MILLVLLPFVVAVYFLVAFIIFYRCFPGKPRKVWAATIVSAIVVFAGDQLVGYTYAYLWVRAVPNPPPLPILSDRIAVESDLTGIHDKPPNGVETKWFSIHAMEMVEAEYWRGQGTPRAGLEASYSTLQVVFPYKSGTKIFDFVVVSDERNAGCKIFFSFPPQTQKRWLDYVQKQWNTRIPLGIKNGQNARCLAIMPASKLQAEYLYKLVARNANFVERLVGFSEVRRNSLTDLTANQVLVEYRSIHYRGGWVQRFFTPRFATGIPVQYYISTPGPTPALRPATPQRVF
jgi:hypothetical protein